MPVFKIFAYKLFCENCGSNCKFNQGESFNK